MVRPGPSRRAVLVAGLLPLVAGACTAGPPTRDPVGPLPAPDPDAALRDAAAERERDLLARYDRALQDPGRLAGRLRALRDEHAAHLAALTALTHPSATPPPAAATGPAPGSPAATGPVAPQELLAAEAAAASAHAGAVPSASRRLAGLLASLAAAEASHAVALGAP